jgi:hypothetical protein
VSPARGLARSYFGALQEQERWYLRPTTSRRTINPNSSIKLTCPVNRPRSLSQALGLTTIDMKASHTLLFACVLATQVCAQEHNYRPPKGLVPNAKTAIAIAVAVWSPIYGEKQIASEKPYIATLAEGKWTVTGSLPKGWAGGVAIAVIARADGQIVRVSHGQ